MAVAERADVKQVVDAANRSDISRKTGISLSGVSRILSGRRVARSQNLAAIALQLGVSMDELYVHLRGLAMAHASHRRRSRRP